MQAEFKRTVAFQAYCAEFCQVNAIIYPKWTKFVVWASIVALIGLCFVPFFVLKAFGTSGVILTLYPIAGVFIYALASKFLIPALNGYLRKFAKAELPKHMDITYAFDDEGLRIHDGYKTIDVNWKKVTALIPSDKYVIFIVGSDAIYMPTSVFNGENIKLTFIKQSQTRIAAAKKEIHGQT